MKIWHVGASRSPNDVNGVNYVIWRTAEAQARIGHEVSLILDGKPGEKARAAAKSRGLDLQTIPISVFRFHPSKIKRLLAEEPPQVVHFHSVFIPQQAELARRLERAGIPSVVTAHGGLSEHILRRDHLKKKIYSRLIEKPRLMRSAAISVVMPKEAEEIRNFVPEYRGMIRFVPNPVGDELFDAKNFGRKKNDRKKIVYLGRFDVEHKGIDILLEIARLMPQADFHLYGADDAKSRRTLAALKRNQTCNAHFHKPVFGAEKIAILQNADLYLQTSRWEVFGISIAEAMTLGTPCAVAETLFIADVFAAENLGIVLDKDPKKAADEISKVLRDEDALANYAARAGKYAAENFAADRIAEKYVDLYRDAIQSERAADRHRKDFEKDRNQVGAVFFEVEEAVGERKVG